MSVAQIREAQQKLQDVITFLDGVIAAAQPAEPVPVLPKAAVGLQQPEAFYDYIRGEEGELFPTMSQSQLEGVEMALHMGAGSLPASWMAYCLATDYHETNRTMQAVKEAYWCSEEWRKKHLRYYPWYGRGLVQLTWDYNYKKATQRLQELGYDVDLVAHPEQALELKPAAVVMVVGMLEGWFTGKKLRDYIPANPERKHFVAARRIINGTDKADLIAGYAIEFHKALKLGDWQ